MKNKIENIHIYYETPKKKLHVLTKLGLLVSVYRLQHAFKTRPKKRLLITKI